MGYKLLLNFLQTQVQFVSPGLDSSPPVSVLSPNNNPNSNNNSNNNNNNTNETNGGTHPVSPLKNQKALKKSESKDSLLKQVQARTKEKKEEEQLQQEKRKKSWSLGRRKNWDRSKGINESMIF